MSYVDPDMVDRRVGHQNVSVFSILLKKLSSPLLQVFRSFISKYEGGVETHQVNKNLKINTIKWNKH